MKKSEEKIIYKTKKREEKGEEIEKSREQRWGGTRNRAKKQTRRGARRKARKKE